MASLDWAQMNPLTPFPTTNSASRTTVAQSTEPSSWYGTESMGNTPLSNPGSGAPGNAVFDRASRTNAIVFFMAEIIPYRPHKNISFQPQIIYPFARM